MPDTELSHDAPARGAGVRTSGDFTDYFASPRPDLRALIPSSARRLLDVGCGGGSFGGTFRSEVPDSVVVGIEGFPEAAAHARKYLDMVLELDLDGLEELPAEAGKFDAITFGDVLEHLLDPERLLAVLSAYLNPGGVMVMSIPNLAHWSVVGPLILDDLFHYEDSGLLDRTHVHFFTLRSISDMCDRLGFEVDALTSSHLAPLPEAAVPLCTGIANATSDPREAIARAGVYQYLLRARLKGEPARPVPAVPAPRTRLGGLEDLIPAGHVRVDVDGPADVRVLDQAMIAAIAAAPQGAPRAFVLDGTMAFTREPPRVLAALADTLSPDDVVVLAERNVSAWHIAGALAVDDQWNLRGEGPVGDHPTHMYTANSLRGLLDDAGLTVLAWHDESDTDAGPYASMLAGLGAYVANPVDVRRNLARRVMRVQAAISRP